MHPYHNLRTWIKRFQVTNILPLFIALITSSCQNDNWHEEPQQQQGHNIRSNYTTPVTLHLAADLESPTRAAFTFEGTTAAPKLQLNSTPMQGVAVIRNENTLIPPTVLPITWQVDAAKRKLSSTLENIQMAYPQDQIPGKWYIGHILEGTTSENLQRINFESASQLTAANAGETKEMSVPFTSNWQEFHPSVIDTMQFHFKPQGTIFRYALRNQSDSDIPVGEIILKGKDNKTLSNSFGIKGYYDLSKMGGRAEAATDFMDTWVHNDGTNDVNTDGKGNKLAKSVTMSLNGNKGIAAKPSQLSPFFPVWVMPATNVGKEMAQQTDAYTTQVFLTLPQSVDPASIPYWMKALYEKPIAEINSTSFPKNGVSYTRYINLKKPEITLKNWMANLPDNMPLYKISIPGTHDSGADHGIGWVKCQDLSIQKQLESGIRFLDIRVSLENGELELRHGSYRLGKNLERDVLAVVRNFLTENPSETVMMTIKLENQSLSIEFLGRFYHEVSNDPTIANMMAGAYHKDMTLGEVRGKMVVISRNREFSGPSGYIYTWRDNTVFDDQLLFNGTPQANIHVQDVYKTSSSTKIDYVKEFIQSADQAYKNQTKVLHFGFTSNTGPLGGSLPSVQATRIDPKIVDYINQNKGLKSCGILIFNYAREDGDLTHAIVNLNPKTYTMPQ